MLTYPVYFNCSPFITFLDRAEAEKFINNQTSNSFIMFGKGEFVQSARKGNLK